MPLRDGMKPGQVTCLTIVEATRATDGPRLSDRTWEIDQLRAKLWLKYAALEELALQHRIRMEALYESDLAELRKTYAVATARRDALAARREKAARVVFIAFCLVLMLANAVFILATQ